MGVLGSVTAAAVGWVLRAERKFALGLTRADHDEICETRQAILENNLREIKAMLVETNREAREHRQRISKALEMSDREAQKYRERQNETLRRLEVKIAVLRTQKGSPPTGDTGNFPR